MPGGAVTVRTPVAFLVAALFVSVLALPLLSNPVDAAKAVPEGRLPTARVGAQSVKLGDQIYVVGGRTASTYLDEIVDFDFTKLTSHVVGHMPAATGALNAGRQSMAVATDGRYVFVFGGAVLVNSQIPDPNNPGQTKTAALPQSTADIIRFDPQTGDATKLTDHLTYPVWGASAVYVSNACSGHGCFFILGGFQFSATDPQHISRHDSIDVFDTTKLITQQVTSSVSRLPYTLQDAPAVFDPNTRYAYLFGGLADNNNGTNTCPIANGQPMGACPVAHIAQFNVDTQLATVVDGAELPHAVQYAMAAELSNRIYVMGGRYLDGTATGVISVFNPGSGRVETIPPTLPGGRFGASAVSDGTFIRIPGGRDAGPNKDGFIDVLKFISTATEPWAPAEVTTKANVDSVSVAWKPPVYDGGAPVSAYNVSRFPQGTAEPPVTLEKVPSTLLSYTDSTARPGVNYTYRVTAINSAGESETGTESDVTTPTRAPSVPLDFRAFPGNGVADLRWSMPVDLGGEPLSVFRIYRNATPQPIATVLGSNLSYVDTRVTNEVQYTYRVSAVNGRGESPLTTPHAVIPVAVPDSPRDFTIDQSIVSLRLSWSAPAGDPTSYTVYRGSTQDHMTILKDHIVERSYEDTNVTRGVLYYYAISAANSRGEGAWSDIVPGGLLLPPDKPYNLLAAGYPGKIALAWHAPDDFGGAAKVFYFVNRSAAGAPTQIIANDLTSTHYVDANVTVGVAYTYSITAYNPEQSEPSTAKTATAKPLANRLPVAVLNENATNVPNGGSVTFDASSSKDPDGRVVSYEFDFGDGTPTSWVRGRPTATHTFTGDTTYTVRLRVMDDRGGISLWPANATIVVGHDASADAPDSTPSQPPITNPPSSAPGTKTGKIPGPGVELVFVGLAGAAIGLGTRKRR